MESENEDILLIDSTDDSEGDEIEDQMSIDVDLNDDEEVDEDDDDDDDEHVESDDPGDIFNNSQILKPVEAAGNDSNTESQMSIEDKVNHIHKQFPSFPKLMIKTVLQRDDVGGKMAMAIACLDEMRGNKAKSSGNPKEGVVDKGISMEPYSLEEKVKALKKEFKTFPPFLIRKVLIRTDVNEDYQTAKAHLEEMSLPKGNTNIGPDPQHGSNQTRGRGNRSRGRGGSSRGRRQCWQKDGTNQSNSPASNIENQSQTSNDINQLQTSNEINQSQAGNQSQVGNTGNQSQTRNNRNRRNRNRNKKQNMQTQQNQGGWVGSGSNYNQQHQYGRGHQGRGGSMPRGGIFQYGMHPQQHLVGPQYQSISPYQQQCLMGRQMIPPLMPQFPPNSRNENFIQGFNQRNRGGVGHQERDGPSYQDNTNLITGPSAHSQPNEPNTVVLRGLNKKTTFDNIRNFIEARTQESVLDIAVSDDQTNAIITLERLSDFNKAKKRVSERQLEGSNVSIERVPVSTSILVSGLSPETTRDGLDFYFSAKSHFDVSDIDIRENTAVITFEDPKAIKAILNARQEHKLDGASLKVCKYHPFLHTTPGQHQRSNNDIVISVDQNKMAFILESSYNEELKTSLQRLGFTLNYKPGDNFAYLTPTVDKVVDKEKGIKHTIKFIERFSTFSVNILKKYQKAAIAGMYELQQEFTKDKAFLVECQNEVKIVCLAKDSDDLKSKFSDKVQEIQNTETRKTHQNQTIDVEEEKLAVLKKYEFIENHLSNAEFPDLDVKMDEDKGTITIVGPKQQFSEAKIKLYQYLAKMCQRQISLSKTVVEMLSSDAGLKKITEKLRERNFSAVFCIEEGDDNKSSKTSVVGVSSKDAESAAELITSLVSEVKIKVESENREVLKSKAWTEQCDKVKMQYQVHVRRNEYLDTWIAGFNNDVQKAHSMLQNFLDQNSIGTDSFICQDDCVRRYLLENRKDDLKNVESNLKQFSVTIKPAEKSNEFVLSGSKTGLERARKSLDFLVKPVTTKVVCVQQPGLKKFFSSGAGNRLVTSVEHEHHCCIKYLTESPSPKSALSRSKAPTGESDDESSFIAGAFLQDGIESDDSSSESDVEDLVVAKSTPVTVSSSGQSTTYQNVKISWKTGNIIYEDADILVASILGQLAKAFKVDKSMHSSITPGNVSVIPPPAHVNQQCLNVILTHCAQWQSGNADQVLRSTVQQSLQEALRLNAQSIAFPVLGTAGLGIPRSDASRVMINEVLNVVGGWYGVSCVNDVRFVVYNQDSQLVTAFQQEFATQLGASGLHSSNTSIPASRASPLVGSISTTSIPGKSGNVSVDTIPGDLLQEQSDAIVNIIGRDLNLSNAGKVSKLLLAAYPGLQTELNNMGPQSEGSAVVTRLSGCNILHVVCEQTDRQHIQSAVENCLETASNHGFRSISLPAFGTGSSGIGAVDSAEATFAAIDNVFQQRKNVRQIRIVIYKDPNMLATFQYVGQQHGRLPGQGKVPKPANSVNSVKSQPLSPVKSAAMSFRIYGRSSSSVDDAETSLVKGCSDSCKTQVVESEEVSALSGRQRNSLQRKANKLDVSIRFENRSQRIVVRGDSADVASMVNDIWIEIKERSEKDKDTEQAKVLYKSVRWQYELNGQTAYFTKRVNATIEKAYVKKDKDVTVKIGGEKLVVDLVRYNGHEASTGRKITVARTTVGSTKSGDISFPREWSPMPLINGKEETVHLFTVTPNSNEFQRVLGLFQSTGGNATVQKIERIQNPHLYEQYMVHKKKMDNGNPGINNEKQLFHGTGAKNLNAINETGFNRSFCGAHGTSYGNGVYFARDASYSMGYAKQSGITGYKHMYLARVLVGRYTQGHSGLIVPPTNYDSVANSTGSGASIFVVFHDARCYPDYLITFR